MKNIILKTAVLAALTASAGAQAYTLSAGNQDFFHASDKTFKDRMDNGEITIDGGKIYRLKGTANVGTEWLGGANNGDIVHFNKTGSVSGNFDIPPSARFNAKTLSSHKGNIVTSSSDFSTNTIRRYDTTAIDNNGNPFTKLTQHNVDIGNGEIGAVAFDSDNEKFYFQKRGGNSTVVNKQDIFTYDIATSTTELFSTQLRETEPSTNGREVEVRAGDMEFVNGALWILQDNGEDPDIFKMNLDGSLEGKAKFDPEGSGFSLDNVDGFDYDEELQKFILTGELDYIGADERDGYYLAEVEGLELETGTPSEPVPGPTPEPTTPEPTIPGPTPEPITPTPPSAVPLPATLPLFGFGLAGLSVFRFKRKKS